MKKSLLVILVLFLIQKHFSQNLTITNCLPVHGDIINTNQTNSSTSTVVVGPPGINQIWNFIDLVGGFTYIDTIKNITPYYQPYYPAANMMRVSTFPNCYLRCGIVGVEVVAKTLGGSLLMYSDPKTIFPCPVSYGETMNDTWTYTFTSSFTNYTVNGTTSFTADASGTIITPGGTFLNALRIHSKSSLTRVSSNNVTDSGLGEDYVWIANGINEPILSVFTNTSNTGSTGTYCTFLNNSKNVVGLKNEIPNNGIIKIYPNPVNDHLFIETSPSSSIRLMNSLGETLIILEKEINGEMSINTSAISSGVYILMVRNGNGQCSQKKVVISH